MSLAFCAVAHAQYVWIDDKGNKQFSDLPPPKSVPKDKILKAPGGAKAAQAPAADDKAASASQAAPKLEKPVTLATKNEDSTNAVPSKPKKTRRQNKKKLQLTTRQKLRKSP
ncbi:hypothetical protein UNDYM_2775 [Undibacterium sp. YM2]|uniref:DUF4124 domain-containing protein n=1 Tax=Undibacterium sp. YM2 TaxID=2058625 RepID=UPI001331C7B0|nr:DUF4124 domain-containing protein [Undibacterium sp. YM2]BBB67028.1 hypothetical protein UNDYM_2775 [Undibacterium sp. YM2]